MKPFFVLLSVFIFPFLLTAQNRSITVYSKSNDALFLVLEIERILSELKINSEDEDVYLFDRVINVNRKIENQDFNKNRRELIDYYDNQLSFELSENARAQRVKESKELYQGDLFLFIQINSFNPLIEYQFSLHQVINDSFLIDQNIIPFPEINSKPLRVNDFFLNPSTSNYLRDLKNSIQALFPDTNSKPVARITIENKKPDSIGEYYFALGDSIKLSGRKSFDVDSRREDLSYFWQQINLDPDQGLFISEEEDLNLGEKSANQALKLDTRGKFALSLTVNDQIQDSSTDTTIINVAHPIEIFAELDSEKPIVQKTLLSKIDGRHSFKERLYKSNIFFLTNIDRELLPDRSLDSLVITFSSLNVKIRNNYYFKYSLLDVEKLYNRRGPYYFPLSDLLTDTLSYLTGGINISVSSSDDLEIFVKHKQLSSNFISLNLIDNKVISPFDFYLSGGAFLGDNLNNNEGRDILFDKSRPFLRFRMGTFLTKRIKSSIRFDSYHSFLTFGIHLTALQFRTAFRSPQKYYRNFGLELGITYRPSFSLTKNSYLSSSIIGSEILLEKKIINYKISSLRGKKDQFISPLSFFLGLNGGVSTSVNPVTNKRDKILDIELGIKLRIFKTDNNSYQLIRRKTFISDWKMY